MQLLSSKIINLYRYEKKSKIGEGSFGKVYVIQKKGDHNIKYAMKVSKNIVDTEEGKKEFINEIIPLIISNYPAILPMIGFNYESINKKKKPTIVTKYALNGSLQDKFKTLSPNQKYIVLLGIAKGMNYLHKHGIIHRDLKPSNVLIDENFYPMISDFGESKVTNNFDSGLRMGSDKGTFVFRAPEMIFEDFYSYKVDVYSYALLFYTVYLEKNPYDEYQNEICFQFAMSKGERPDLSNVQNLLIRNFIQKCWNSSASLRPSFKQIVEEMLTDEFKKSMGANEDEVQKYLSLFNDDENDDFYKNPIIMQMNADEGNLDDMLDFAILVFYGHGVPKNYKLAENYLKRSADSGNIKAMYIYAYILFNGNYIKKNIKKAAEYLRMAAEKGNSDACINYAIMLYCGIGIDINKNEALKLFKNAAERGNPDSCHIYAEMLYNGINVEQDKALAAGYFKVSADQGNVQAMYIYATMRFNGDGVNVNKTEALFYYKKATGKDDEDSFEKFCVSQQQRMKEETTKLITLFDVYGSRPNDLSFFDKFINYVRRLWVFGSSSENLSF